MVGLLPVSIVIDAISNLLVSWYNCLIDDDLWDSSWSFSEDLRAWWSFNHCKSSILAWYCVSSSHGVAYATISFFDIEIAVSWVLKIAIVGLIGEEMLIRSSWTTSLFSKLEFPSITKSFPWEDIYFPFCRDFKGMYDTEWGSR